MSLLLLTSEPAASFAVLGDIGVETEIREAPLAFSVDGTIDVESEVDSRVRALRDDVQGATGAFIYDTSFQVPAGYVGPLTVLSWSTKRRVNRIGEWDCVIAVDDHPTGGVPLHRLIKRGWHLSLVQENNNPNDDVAYDYMVYHGVILDREYRIEEAGATLTLHGSFRTQHTVERSTLNGLAIGPDVKSGIESLIGDDELIGAPGGPVVANVTSAVPIDATFYKISRFAAALKVAQIGRLTYRDGWDFDRPEWVTIDNPPFSGYTLVNVEAYDAALEHAAKDGWGLIASTPTVEYVGSSIVNKIIPIGSDTVGDDNPDLTLAPAIGLVTPYDIRTGLNPDGSNYYYIQDDVSVTRYGLIERHLVRTDIKNPSDDAGTRQAAAKVLAFVAAGELLKNKSEIIEIKIPVANGPQIWALPGDSIWLRYMGEVLTDDGYVSWLDVDQLFLVTDRSDASHPSGVRRVDFTLAAPEIEIPIPGLPGAISLPPTGSGGGIYGAPPPAPLPPDNPAAPGCCDDPTTDIPSGGPDDGSTFIPGGGGTVTPPGGPGTGGGGGGGGGTGSARALVVNNRSSGMGPGAGTGDYKTWLYDDGEDIQHGDVLIVSIENKFADDEDPPTLPTIDAIGGMTFTQVATKDFDGDYRQTVFAAMIPFDFDIPGHSSAVDDFLNVHFGGVDQDLFPVAVVIRVRGVSATPVQSVATSANSGTMTATVAMAPAASAQNIFLGILSQFSALDANADWTKVPHTVLYSPDAFYIYDFAHEDDPSWTLLTDSRWSCVAVELDTI